MLYALNFEGPNFSQISFAQKIFAGKNIHDHAYCVFPRPTMDRYKYVIPYLRLLCRGELGRMHRSLFVPCLVQARPSPPR